MAYPRWYPTATTLPDGRVLVTSGTTNCPTCIVDIPEVYDPATNTWTELTNARLAVPVYPFMFVLPDGRVLNAGAEEERLETRVLDVQAQTWTMVDPVPLSGGSAAMYIPGRVVKSGAVAFDPSNTSLRETWVLDMTQPSPAWRATAPMAFPRSHHNLTILADGTVLVVGGGRTTDGVTESQAVYEAELWWPETETWSTMAQMQVPRLYHSTALLLPDGRVLVAGGGRYGPDQTNAEVYSPPYLFRGVRPTITLAPSSAQYGSNFQVTTADASSIARVSLARLGAVTHSFNQDQRYLDLSFQQSVGSLTVQAPSNANVAPPGYYMLFLVNDAGVPSVAAFVSLSGAPPTNNPVPTTTGLNPASVTAGGPPFTLTVNGTNFINGSMVRWNGADRATTFVSPSQVTAAISSGDLATAGPVSVIVFNPAPGGGTSNAQTFTISTSPNPVPTTTSLNPTSATVGGAALTLTVNGTNFVAGSSVVRWNGANRTTMFVSASQLTASIPATDLATAGTASVTVFNPAPGGGTSNAQTFTISTSTSTTVTFDNPIPPGSSGSFLNGLFQGINFGTSQWRWENAYGADSTRHIYFGSGTSRTFAFSPGPRTLVNMRVFTGAAGTLTLTDNLGQTRTQSITTGSMQMVTTGWTQPSTTVTVTFTAGWELGVDDIVYRNP